MVRKKEKKVTPKKIIWVDDCIYDVGTYSLLLKDEYDLVHLQNIDEVIPSLDENIDNVALVIVDVRLNPREFFSVEETKGGYTTGIHLAAHIKKKYPTIPIIAFSIVNDTESKDLFKRFGDKYIVKDGSITPSEFYNIIDSIIKKKKQYPKIFIVHGHNNALKLELKNFIQNTLKLGEPIILHEKPNKGRTIIEKLEEEGNRVDVVFVLLTPDDKILSLDAPSDDEVKALARQNVIFEMGFFLGKLGRRTGRVILCYKGPIELPSDVHGLVYLYMKEGLDDIKDEIRAELSEWLE